MSRPRRTIYRHRVRYLEADQQGVVFNMWYLGYFDEAMAAFLEEGGLAYPDMLAAGFDVQLVHTEIDWQSSLRWQDEAEVEVELGRAGTTSFDLNFTVSTGSRPGGHRAHGLRGGGHGRVRQATHSRPDPGRPRPGPADDSPVFETDVAEALAAELLADADARPGPRRAGPGPAGQPPAVQPRPGGA